jgi:hypothetical protein
VGKHRRISAAPSDPCAANADGCIRSARREALLAVARDARSTVSEIDRPVDPSPRTVNGGQGSSPSPGLASGAPRRVGGSCSPGAHFFAEPHSYRTSRPHRYLCCGHTGQVLASSPGVSCVLIQAADPIALTSATPRRRRDRSHHPATAAAPPLRSALAKSNHSDMAAFARSDHPCRVPGSVARRARVSAFSPDSRGQARNSHRKAPK